MHKDAVQLWIFIIFGLVFATALIVTIRSVRAEGLAAVRRGFREGTSRYLNLSAEDLEEAAECDLSRAVANRMLGGDRAEFALYLEGSAIAALDLLAQREGRPSFAFDLRSIDYAHRELSARQHKRERALRASFAATEAALGASDAEIREELLRELATTGTIKPLE